MKANQVCLTSLIRNSLLTWLDLNVNRHCSYKQLREEVSWDNFGQSKWEWTEPTALASYGADKKEGGDIPRFLSVRSPCMNVLHISEISLIRNARRKGGGEL